MSEERGDRTALIAVIAGVVALLLGLCLGATLGGIGGYFIGKGVGQPALQPMEVPDRNLEPPARIPLPPGLQVPDLSDLSGAWIREVVRGSPADQAGLQVGDIITAVDDTRLDADHGLADVIASHRPGDRVQLTVWRFGDTLTLDVTLGKAEDGDRAFLGVRYADFSMENHPPNPRD